MNYAVKTTHAIPTRAHSLFLVNKESTVTCAWCGERLGTCRNAAEREILEACHGCQAKMLALGPVVTVPFS